MPSAEVTKPEMDTTPAPSALPPGSIERLYEIYERLSGAENKVTLEKDFRELLSAVKGDDKQKRLASQFISSFVEHFPLLQSEAIDALLDLCEDDDILIRKQAEKDMLRVCQKNNTLVPKVADVYSQLMQTSDQSELSNLQQQLYSLFHIDAKGTLVGVFSQIQAGEEVVRSRCIKFLDTRLKGLSPELATPAFESTLLACIKRVLSDANSEDFKTLISILMQTKLLKTLSGQQAVVDMVADQLKLDQDIDLESTENLDRVLICCKQVQPLFSSKVSPAPFCAFFCQRVLPKLMETGVFDDTNTSAVDALKMSAELSVDVNQMDSQLATDSLEAVYNAYLELLPLPGDGDAEEGPKYDFNSIECFLVILHRLGSFAPDFLSEADRLKDLRQRLQYFSRSSQAYNKKLRDDLKPADSKADLKTDANRVKLTAMKIINNISSIIKDLFHTPPSYKTQIRLSWEPMRNPMQIQPLKRKASIPPMNLGPKQNRGSDRERVLYQPPSGKFSKLSGSYASQPSGRQNRGSYRGGAGRGGFRGNRRPFRGRP